MKNHVVTPFICLSLTLSVMCLALPGRVVAERCTNRPLEYAGAIMPIVPVTVKPQQGRVMTAQSPLNIRSGPGTQYPVLWKAPKGSLLIIMNTSSAWYQVCLPTGQRGFASSRYIRLLGSVSTFVPFITMAQGSHPGFYTGPSVVVAQNQAELAHMYEAVFGGSASPPGIDFRFHTVIGLCRANTHEVRGHRIRHLIAQDDSLVVAVTSSSIELPPGMSPQPGYDYHLILLPKTWKAVYLVDERDSGY